MPERPLPADAPLTRRLTIDDAGPTLTVRADAEPWRPQLGLATVALAVGYLAMGLAVIHRFRVSGPHVPPVAPPAFAALTTYLSLRWLHAATTTTTLRAAAGRLEWTHGSALWRTRRRWDAAALRSIDEVPLRHLNRPVHALRITPRTGPTTDALYHANPSEVARIARLLREALDIAEP